MVVIGFSENSRGRIDGLHLARADENGNILYAGTLHKGFDAGDLAELEKRLRPIATRRTPFVALSRKPKAKWLEPKVLVEVAFPNLSAGGRVRHPSFKGIRDDLESL